VSLQIFIFQSSKLSFSVVTPSVRNAIKRVFYGLAGERSRLLNWPDPSPARSLSLVVGQVVGGDLVIKVYKDKAFSQELRLLACS